MVIITGKRNSILIAKVSLQIVKVFFFPRSTDQELGYLATMWVCYIKYKYAI